MMCSSGEDYESQLALQGGACSCQRHSSTEDLLHSIADMEILIETKGRIVTSLYLFSLFSTMIGGHKSSVKEVSDWLNKSRQQTVLPFSFRRRFTLLLSISTTIRYCSKFILKSRSSYFAFNIQEPVLWNA